MSEKDEVPATEATDAKPDNPDHIPREREESLCPCKSRLAYKDCCLPYHYGRAQPKTAEALMRSRYSAYFFRRTDYLADTTHPDTKTPTLKKELDAMIYKVGWSNLTIVNTAKGGPDDKIGKVEFIAEYYVGSDQHELHEVSRFRRHKGRWKYLDGKS